MRLTACKSVGMKRLASTATWWQPSPHRETRGQRRTSTGRRAMDNIGLDLHKRESQLCILSEAGELLERRIATTRDRFTAVLGGRAPARILIEASTESEWVARHLERL